MGQSTDAIIGYGYAWTVGIDEMEKPPPWADETDEEWYELLARRRGAVNPWDARYAEDDGQPVAYEEFAKANAPAIEAWKAATGEAKGAFNVEVGTHCSVDYPMLYVALKGTCQLAWRGSPKELTDLRMPDNDLPESADAQLQKFVDELGLDTSEAIGPCWFLASDWG